MTTDQSVNPLSQESKTARSQKKISPAPETAIRVELHPLPEPPDMAERLAKIYTLAAKRYAEHHGKKAVG